MKLPEPGMLGHNGRTEGYTAKQMQEYAKQARDLALEEAAQVAQKKSGSLPHYDDWTRGLAEGRASVCREIRALKEQP